MRARYEQAIIFILRLSCGQDQALGLFSNNLSSCIGDRYLADNRNARDAIVAQLHGYRHRRCTVFDLHGAAVDARPAIVAHVDLRGAERDQPQRPGTGRRT